MSENGKLRGQQSFDDKLKDATLDLLRSDQRGVFIFTYGKDGRVRVKTAYNDERAALLITRIELLMDRIIPNDPQRENDGQESLVPPTEKHG